mmetsp:Transcript_157039/g.301315  ORF Transcript_157039/g.301315 Transcript_157039/m.301315 type:complete len:478 (-) Transcript_157039:29-1462(-)
MEILATLLGACNTIKKADAIDDSDASELQLNAFEFRNYRTNLEPKQQELLERIVNQWCSLMVKGKTLKVNNFEEKVYIDKDLLTLEYSNEFYPLRTIRKMELFKDTDDMMGAPWVIEITFEGVMGDRNLIFNFEQERQRLNFALTLRILRTRDPSLDQSQAMEVSFQEDEDEEEERRSFKRIVDTQHYKVKEVGIPVIFSVSDLKLYQKLQSTSRHVYLEFFVRYPNQDQFLYAKSPTTHIPPQVLQTEDAAFRRKKEKKDEAEEEEERRRQEAQKKQEKDGVDIAICAMRFDLKNVKLKVPKIPHSIFGRLMAKDDYFPTAVGTFEFKVEKNHLQDKRNIDAEDKMREHNGKEDGSRKEPETMTIPLMSAIQKGNAPKAGSKGKEEEGVRIGLLTIRLIGYVTDAIAYRGGRTPEEGGGERKAKKKAKDDSMDEDGSEGNVEGSEEEGSEGEEEEEEDEDGEFEDEESEEEKGEDG